MGDSLTVGLVFGGRSVEHRVSVVSARTVAAGLSAAGYGVEPLGIARNGAWASPEESTAALDGTCNTVESKTTPLASFSRLSDSGVDVVFPLVHGTWGEDGTLQGMVEMLNLPYVGAGVAASAVAMDKRLAKQILASAGIPVVADCSVSRREWEADPGAALKGAKELGFPLFVKPAVGGSSVGVRKVKNEADLPAAVEFALQFDDWVLIERGIDARELECAVLGYLRPAASAVGEVIPGGEFYDYADKYLDDKAGFKLPADLPDETAAKVRNLAVEAFRAIGCSGMARIDFLLDKTNDALFLNEINTVPGFTSISMYPKLWEVSGLPLPALLARLVDAAVRRHADRAALDRGIGEWLGSLGD